MNKYIAFDLFTKNDQGGRTLVDRGPVIGIEVYRAHQADALLEGLAAKLEAEIAVAYNEYSNGQRAAYEHAAQLLRSLMGSST